MGVAMEGRGVGCERFKRHIAGCRLARLLRRRGGRSPVSLARDRPASSRSSTSMDQRVDGASQPHRIARRALATCESAGGFPVVSSSRERTVLGFDDRHLDFRIVVDLQVVEDGSVVRVTTLVRRKNLFGRIYLFAAGPFHRRIVPPTMRPFCTHIHPVLLTENR